MLFDYHSFGFLLTFLISSLSLLILKVAAQEPAVESVKNFGEQFGLALLDGLLQKSQEEVARQSLKKQIELLQQVNPSYAEILRQIPPEQLIAAAISQRQLYAPDTGNPFLNILAKNGILVSSNEPRFVPDQQQQQPKVENIFQTILRNILQSVQPSLVQNSLFGPHIPTQEVTNPLAPNANKLVIPDPNQPALPGPQLLLGALGGSALGGNKKTAATDAPPNPFGPGLPDAGSITIPPNLFSTTSRQERRRTTTVHEKVTVAANEELSAEETEEEVRAKRLEELNNRANRLLALRKLRLGAGSIAKTTIASKVESAVEEEVKGGEPTVALPKIIDDQNVEFNPIGINTRNFALLARNSKTHTQLRGSSKFGRANENGQGIQLPVEGLPPAGFGDKFEEGTLLKTNAEIPRNWLNGQELSLGSTFAGNRNSALFGGVDLDRIPQPG